MLFIRGVDIQMGELYTTSDLRNKYLHIALNSSSTAFRASTYSRGLERGTMKQQNSHYAIPIASGYIKI
jgi:hypothetical protein